MYNTEHSWWRHQMEAFSALLAPCAGNSPVIGEFPSQMASNAELRYLCDVSWSKLLSKRPNDDLGRIWVVCIKTRCLNQYKNPHYKDMVVLRPSYLLL